MAYGKLTLGKDSSNLEELEYIFTKGRIAFSTFTSCIGIVGKMRKEEQDCLMGVHLPFSATEDVNSKFDSAAAKMVIGLFEDGGFKNGEDDWCVCGLSNMWKDSANGVDKAYGELELWFSGSWQNPAENIVDSGSGDYWVDSKLVIHHEAKKTTKK